MSKFMASSNASLMLCCNTLYEANDWTDKLLRLVWRHLCMKAMWRMIVQTRKDLEDMKNENISNHSLVVVLSSIIHGEKGFYYENERRAQASTIMENRCQLLNVLWMEKRDLFDWNLMACALDSIHTAFVHERWNLEVERWDFSFSNILFLFGEWVKLLYGKLIGWLLTDNFVISTMFLCVAMI